MKIKKKIRSIVAVGILAIVALFFINISLAANTAKISVETANLRETADVDSKILEQLSLNDEVEVLEKNSDWYKVKSKGITGYLRKDLVQVDGEESNTKATQEIVQPENQETQNTVEENTKTQNTVQENATVETSAEEVITEGTTFKVIEDTKLKIVPSINATDIIEVKQGEEVTITETLNNWICVQTKTTKGWIRKEKLKSKKQEEEEKKQAEEQQVQETVIKTLYINADTANLRKEANTNSEIITKLTLNTSVDIYKEENGWSKIKVDGKEGYISSSLLSNKKKETSRSSETIRTSEQTTKSENKEKVATKETTTKVETSQKGATVVATAKNYIGSAYVYGATGPNSFDCSGFTSYVFKLHGVTLNRTAAAQYSNGVAVGRSQLEPGDLIMFGSSASNINHVGIYIGGGQIVHAANKTRGVTTDTINLGYYNNNYVGARRIM